MKSRHLVLSAAVAGAAMIAACAPPPPAGPSLYADPVAPGTCLVNEETPFSSIRYDGPADGWANASLVETPDSPAGCADAPLASINDPWTLVKATNASRAKALCVLLAPVDLQFAPGVTTDQAIRADQMNQVGFAAAPDEAYICQVSFLVG